MIRARAEMSPIRVDGEVCKCVMNEYLKLLSAGNIVPSMSFMPVTMYTMMNASEEFIFVEHGRNIYIFRYKDGKAEFIG